MNFKPRPIGKLNHPFEKLGPNPRILRSIIQIHNQAPDATACVSHTCPPRTQTITPEITCFVIAKQQCQCPGRQNQNAKRNQLFFGGRIMVPAFNDMTMTVSPCFSPPRRILPNRLLPWYQAIFLAPGDHRDTDHEQHERLQISHRCLLFSSTVCLSGFA